MGKKHESVTRCGSHHGWKYLIWRWAEGCFWGLWRAVFQSGHHDFHMHREVGGVCGSVTFVEVLCRSGVWSEIYLSEKSFLLSNVAAVFQGGQLFSKVAAVMGRRCREVDARSESITYVGAIIVQECGLGYGKVAATVCLGAQKHRDHCHVPHSKRKQDWIIWFAWTN